MTTATKPLFELGRVTITSGAQEELARAMPGGGEPGFVERYNRTLAGLIERHVRGDWGDVDDEDKATNDRSVVNGTRILSSYRPYGVKLWIITDGLSDACPACWAGLGTCEPEKGDWHAGMHFRNDLPPRRQTTTILRPEDY